MRVIQVTRFGPPEVLTPASVPDPVPGPGEAVITVAAADVLFLDTLIRSGRATQWFPVRPPYVPGNGVAGQVASVGDGVDPGWAGRRVIARTGGSGGAGGYAERAVVSAGQLVPVPGELDLSQSVALLHDGATALRLIASTGARPGERVLITGAAGGLGLLLLQLARAAGAQVIGAARGSAKLAVLWDLGADAVVDYGEPGWTKRVTEATGGDGPDVVFDGAGGQLGREAFEIMADGGRVSAHGSAGGGFAPISPDEAARRGITVRGIEQVQLRPGEHEALAQSALAELAAGHIRPIIGQLFPLAQAADAHAALEARSAPGKTLLTVP
ncbi:MAG: zinc-binding dehydrogenase [Actinobacteria bacterium]|nr:zinc-binding dehydrogenase [Actinomycetota bacterium]